jgi:hypothetical protein
MLVVVKIGIERDVWEPPVESLCHFIATILITIKII